MDRLMGPLRATWHASPPPRRGLRTSRGARVVSACLLALAISLLAAAMLAAAAWALGSTHRAARHAHVRATHCASGAGRRRSRSARRRRCHASKSRRCAHGCTKAASRPAAAGAGAAAPARAFHLIEAPAGLTSQTLVNGTPPQKPPANVEPLRLFSETSVYNQQLPAATPLASNSAQLVSDFVSQVQKYYGHVVINTTEWSTPVYVVGPEQQTVAMVGKSSICPRPEGVYQGFQAQINAVPMPADAVPAAGADKEVVVYQPSTGHLWELWRVLEESGRWTACWGGKITNARTSDGIFPSPYGAAASGLSLLGGQIHLEDLEHGVIDHALEVLMPDTADGTFVWPADRTDGTSTASDAIPEGTRLRLKPSLDLASLHLSAPALEIATAIQRYGIIVGDTAGAVALSAQDPTPLIDEGKPNPYGTLLPNPDTALEAIPWGDLEAVSSSYQG